MEAIKNFFQGFVDMIMKIINQIKELVSNIRRKNDEPDPT